MWFFFPSWFPFNYEDEKFSLRSGYLNKMVANIPLKLVKLSQYKFSFLKLRELRKIQWSFFKGMDNSVFNRVETVILISLPFSALSQISNESVTRIFFELSRSSSGNYRLQELESVIYCHILKVVSWRGPLLLLSFELELRDVL